MWRSGAEKTREELRKQVYDAMAEEEKAEVKLESEGVTSDAAVENENVEIKAPVKQCVSGSEAASSSPLEVEQKSSVLEAEEKPEPPSEGKTVTENKTDPEKQNAEEAEEGEDEDSKPETDEDKSEGIKGSNSTGVDGMDKRVLCTTHVETHKCKVH